jgi:hypothetical protein
MNKRYFSFPRSSVGMHIALPVQADISELIAPCKYAFPRRTVGTSVKTSTARGSIGKRRRVAPLPKTTTPQMPCNRAIIERLVLEMIYCGNWWCGTN